MLLLYIMLKLDDKIKIIHSAIQFFVIQITVIIYDFFLVIY
jgi:hypothetical protein